MSTVLSTAVNLLAADHWGRHHHPWFPVVPLVLIAIWIVVIVGVRRRWRHVGPRVSAESVLAERYARGEIDESEFRARRSVLRDRK